VGDVVDGAAPADIVEMGVEEAARRALAALFGSRFATISPQLFTRISFCPAHDRALRRLSLGV